MDGMSPNCKLQFITKQLYIRTSRVRSYLTHSFSCLLSSSHHRPGSLYTHISKQKLLLKEVHSSFQPTPKEELAKLIISGPEMEKLSVSSVAEQRRILFHTVCERLRTHLYEGKSHHYWKKVLLITMLLGVWKQYEAVPAGYHDFCRYALQERATRSVLPQRDLVQSGRKDFQTLSPSSLQ